MSKHRLAALLQVFLGLSLVLFCPATMAWSGRLVLAGGQEFKGQLEFVGDNQVAVEEDNGQMTVHALAEVARLVFQEAAPTDQPWITLIEPQQPGAALPPPWTSADIGRTPKPGEAYYQVEQKEGRATFGAFQFRTRSLGLMAKEDSCAMIYQGIPVQGEVIAKVINIHPTGHKSTVGVTIRADLTPDSAMVSLTLTEGGDAFLIVRGKKGGEARCVYLAKIWPMHWLRLERRQNDVAAFTSKNGWDWKYADTVTVDLPADALAGGVCASSQEDKTSYSRLAFLTVRPAPEHPHRLVLRDGTTLTGKLLSSDAPNLNFRYRGETLSLSTGQAARVVFNPLPQLPREEPERGKSGWLTRKGELIEAAMTRIEGNRIQVKTQSRAKEILIGRDADALVFQPVQPEAALAEVWTEDGELLFASSLQLEKDLVVAEIPLAGVVKFKSAELREIRRLGDLAPAREDLTPTPGARRLDRLVTRESGNRTGRVEIKDGEIRFRPSQGALETVAPESIVELRLAPPPDRPPAAEPADQEWRGLDFAEQGRGSFLEQASAMTIEAGGKRILNTEDSFFFLAKPFRGNWEISARLVAFDGELDLARAGLMIRESPEAGARNYFIGRSLTKGAIYQRRNGKGGNTEQEAHPEIELPLWLKLEREGKYFSGYYSTDGQKWTVLGTAYTAMSEEFFGGLAVCSGDEQVVVRAVFDGVRARCFDPVPYRPRIVLRNGSEIAGDIQAADDTSIKIRSAVGKELAVSLVNVSRLVFQPMSPENLAAPQNGQSGILMRNGDFMKGEFLGLDRDQIRLKSVLFGLRDFKFPQQAAAVILRPLDPAEGRWRIEMADGSRLVATGFQVRGSGLAVSESILGSLTVPSQEVESLRRIDSPAFR